MGGDNDQSFSPESPHHPRHGGHDPQKRFACLFCSYRFKHYRQLEEHMHTHTKERPHHCDKCDLSFSAGKSLWEHHRVYHLGKLWKCLVCGMEFTTTSALSSHKKTHFKKTREEEIEEKEEEKGISSAFKNAVVKWKAISSEETCEKKTERKREEETPPPPAKKMKLKLVLKKEITSVRSFPSNRKVKRKWVCDICGKIFKRIDNYSLKRHRRTVHKILNDQGIGSIDTSTGKQVTAVEEEEKKPEVKISNPKVNRKWTCKICNRVFNRPDNYSLKRHLQSVHQLSGELLTKLCSQSQGQGQPSEENVRSALAVVVAADKGKKLLINYNTNRVKNFRRQRKVKSGASAKKKGDTCPFCGKVFSRLDSVYRHIERFHSEEDEEEQKVEEDEEEQGDDDGEEKQIEEDDEDDEYQDQVKDVVGQDKGEMWLPPFEIQFPDAPVELKLHPPYSIPFFNFPPPNPEVNITTDHYHHGSHHPPQPKKEWDPMFFLHMNRYDPKKDAESLKPPPPLPPPPAAPASSIPATPPPPAKAAKASIFTCDKCGRQMAHKWSLQRHQKHDRCTKPSKKMFQSPALPTLRYVCAFCNKDFNERRAHLVRHLASVHRFASSLENSSSAQQTQQHHPPPAIQSRRNRNNFSCVYCNQRTETKDKMQVHIAKNHLHLLGVPRDEYSNAAAAKPPQLQPHPQPPCEIIDISDSSLSSSMGSSLIEVTVDDPNPHPPPQSSFSPYQSESDESSIVFIEELQERLNSSPANETDVGGNFNSGALTEVVDSQVLPSSSACLATQEIPRAHFLLQLDREGSSTSSTTSASSRQSTAPSSPASVVSESELETTLDEDVLSPAIPEGEDIYFKSGVKRLTKKVTMVASSSSSSPSPPQQEVAFEKEVETIIEALLPLVSRFDFDSLESPPPIMSSDGTPPPPQPSFMMNHLPISPVVSVVSPVQVQPVITISQAEASPVVASKHVNSPSNIGPSSAHHHHLANVFPSSTFQSIPKSPPVIPHNSGYVDSIHLISQSLSLPAESPPHSPSSSSMEINEERVQSPQTLYHGNQEEMERGVAAIPEHVDTPPSISEYVQSPQTSPVPPKESHETVESVESPPNYSGCAQSITISQQSSPQSMIQLEESPPDSPSSFIKTSEQLVQSPHTSVSIPEERGKGEDFKIKIFERVSSPPSIPEQVESPPVQHAKLMEITINEESTFPLDYPTILEHTESPPVTLECGEPASMSQSSPHSIHLTNQVGRSTPNSPSPPFKIIDECSQTSPPTSPPQTTYEEIELAGVILEQVDVPPSIPEQVESPQTPSPPQASPIVTLNEKPVTFQITSPPILEHTQSPPAFSTCIEPVATMSESPPHSATQLEHSPPNSESPLSIKPIKENIKESPQASQPSSPNVVSQQAEPPILEPLDSPSPPSIPEYVVSPPHTPPLPPKSMATAETLPESRETEDVQVIVDIHETMKSLAIHQSTLPEITLNEDSPPATSECVDSAPHSQESPPTSSLICEYSPSQSPPPSQPPSPHVISQPADSPPQPPLATLPIPDVEPPKTRESPSSSPSPTNSRYAANSESISEPKEYTPNSPSSSSSSSSIEMIDEPLQSPQTSPHAIPQENEPDHPISEKFDTPSIPQHLESPQGSPPTSLAAIPQEMEPLDTILERVQIETAPIPENVESSNALPESESEAIVQFLPDTLPTADQCETLQIPPVSPEVVEPTSVSGPSPSPHSNKDVEESPPNSPSHYIQIIDECLESPQGSQPTPPPPHIIPEHLDDSPQSATSSPPEQVQIIPETLESPYLDLQHDTRTEITSTEQPAPFPVPLPISTPAISAIPKPLESSPSIPENVESPPPASPPLIIPEPPALTQSMKLVLPEHFESSVTLEQCKPPEMPPHTPKQAGKTPRAAATRRRTKHKVEKPPLPTPPIVTTSLGYFCHLCPLSFQPTARGRYHLSRHLAGIHRHENRTAKFACIFCGLENSKKDAIQRHIHYQHEHLLKITSKTTNPNQQTEQMEKDEEDAQEEDLTPPHLERMDLHVQFENGGDDDEEDQDLPPPPLLTLFHCS